jgi:hypothetical protein
VKWLPGLGTATNFQGTGSNPEAFFSYSDYLSPTRIMRVDVASNAVSEFRKPNVPADFSPFLTEQVFYTSKDGTRVPMFITRRRDAPRDGNRPVMLYGYGGFNVTLSPSFSPSVQSWLEMGGVMRSPTCVVAANTVKTGTRPARNSRNRTCSTTSSRPRNPDSREVHQSKTTRDPGAQQWRIAGRRRA